MTNARWFRFAVLLLQILGSTAAYGQALPLSVRVADEQIPPGGIIQVKLEITEPKPISTGSGFFDFGGFDDLVGVAVHSTADDAAAVVLVRPQGLAVSLVSPSSSLGLEPDYPILTMAMRVPASTPVGSRRALNLTGATFRDPSGATYPFEFHAGEALIRPGPAVTAVSPGSATVPAGSTITLEGLGFDADTRVRFNETSLASVRVISPTLIQAVVDRQTTMHGQGIEVRNGNNRSTYFSYQRTVPIGSSAHPLMAAVHPAFPARQWTDAMLRFSAAGPAVVHGIALQNLGSVGSTVVLELADEARAVSRRTSIVVAPNTRLVRTLADVFAQSCDGRRCSVRVQATSPIQLLGVVGDVTQSAATPLLPEAMDGATGVRLATDAAAYAPGGTMTLTVETSSANAAVADLYLVLSTPDGTLRSLTPGGLVTGLVPWLASQSVGTPSRQVLRLPIPSGTPPGPYTWLSALTAPGTLSLVSAIAQAPFAVLP